MISLAIMVFSGAAMLLKVITFEQFMIAEGAAVALLATTSALRATSAATETRVANAVNAGAVDGTIPVVNVPPQPKP